MLPKYVQGYITGRNVCNVLLRLMWRVNVHAVKEITSKLNPLIVFKSVCAGQSGFQCWCWCSAHTVWLDPLSRQSTLCSCCRWHHRPTSEQTANPGAAESAARQLPKTHEQQASSNTKRQHHAATVVIKVQLYKDRCTRYYPQTIHSHTALSWRHTQTHTDTHGIVSVNTTRPGS